MFGERNAGASFPITRDEDRAWWDELSAAFVPDARLPEWPFADAGAAVFCQWNDVFSGDFASVLGALCRFHGDAYVLMATLGRSGSRVLHDGRLIPMFRMGAEEIRPDTYWEAIQHEPGGMYRSTIFPGGSYAALSGSSRRWSIWGEADFETAVLRSVEIDGPWRTVVDDLRFHDVDTAISEFIEPALGDTTTAEGELRTFRRNFA